MIEIEELLKLIAKWRGDDATSLGEMGFGECADDLEALINADPIENHPVRCMCGKCITVKKGVCYFRDRTVVP